MMPDISMCADDQCPSRGTCRRSPDGGAQPTPGWQTWTAFARSPGSSHCPSYYPANSYTTPTDRAP